VIISWLNVLNWPAMVTVNFYRGLCRTLEPSLTCPPCPGTSATLAGTSEATYLSAVRNVSKQFLLSFAMWGWVMAVGLSSTVCLGTTFQDRTGDFYPAGLGDKAAWGDYDKDGWVDLSANGDVLRNNGGTSFSYTGYGVGPGGIWGDFDNDGNLDLFGYSHASKPLLMADGNGGFIEANDKIPSFGLTNNHTHISRGAAWADFNDDGKLDLYVGGYEIFGDNTTFADVILTYDSGTEQFEYAWQDTAYRARGVTAADFDRDGDQDVYVSNYRLQPNRLWRNNGTGSFDAVAGEYGAQGGAGHAIGAAWGDVDNDGEIDLFVGNFAHGANYFGNGNPRQPESRFLRNRGPAEGYTFENMGQSGVDWQESYASPALGDYDNDGDLDLFFTTVYGHNAPRLYRNDGNWQFSDVSDSAGLSGLEGTYQAAWADVDNDGDLDLATAGKLFVNDSQSNGNHWLKVHLEGNGTTVNRSAIGAQVRVAVGGKTLTRQVEGGTGEGNQNDLTLHFGLGAHTGPLNLEVQWPDGWVDTVPVSGVDRAVIVAGPDRPTSGKILFDDFNDDIGGLQGETANTGQVWQVPLPGSAFIDLGSIDTGTKFSHNGTVGSGATVDECCAGNFLPIGQRLSRQFLINSGGGTYTFGVDMRKNTAVELGLELLNGNDAVSFVWWGNKINLGGNSDIWNIDALTVPASVGDLRVELNIEVDTAGDSIATYRYTSLNGPETESLTGMSSEDFAFDGLQFFVDGGNGIDLSGGYDNLTVEFAIGEEEPVGSDRTWNNTEGGNWFAGPWTFGRPEANQRAIFGDSIEGNASVFVANDVNVNAIDFDNPDHTYAIVGTATVYLSAGDLGQPEIKVLSGDHQFQAAVGFNGNTTVIGGTGSLNFNNEINLNGNLLTLSGDVGINHSVTDTAGGGAIVSSGSLRTAGTTVIAGDLTSTGALEVDINGDDAGKTDQFLILGTANLTGVLSVDVADHFVPSGTFPVVWAETLIGGLTLGGPDSDLFSLDFNTATGVVSLIAGPGPNPDGDFNNDGIVDAADYTLWKDNFGQPDGTLPNDNALTGPIGRAHYVLWKNNFGTGSGTLVAIPEPSGLALGLLTTLMGMLYARRRQVAGGLLSD